MQRVKVGDEVIVIRGNDKAKRGKVTRVLRDRDMVVVEGINQVKRHVRSAPERPGGILEMEAPIHASKVMLIDPETGKRTRVRFQEQDGQKVRLAKSGAAIAPQG